MLQDPEESIPDLAIESIKITAYLLNADHPEGGSKAKFFIARGFSLDDEKTFVEALMGHAIAGHLARELSNEHGVKRVYEGPLPCPDGTSPRVRSIWHKAPGHFMRLLVTAYPIRASGDRNAT